MVNRKCFDRLAEVEEQVETVDDLAGLRRALRGRGRVGVVAVADDHLDARVRRQPPRDRAAGTVGQHVDGPVALQVDDQRAIGQAPPEREVVDTHHPRWIGVGLGRLRDEAQDGVVADGQAEALGQARPGAPAQGEADLPHVGLVPVGAACVRLGQAREALGEAPARTDGVPAVEPPNPQDEDEASAAHWAVHHGALVPALEVSGARAARGATRRVAARGRPHRDGIHGELGRRDVQVGELGQDGGQAHGASSRGDATPQ